MPTVKGLIEEANEIVSQAAYDGRELDPSERRYVDSCLARAKAYMGGEPNVPYVGSIDSIGRELGGGGARLAYPFESFGYGDPGARFVNSKEFKALQDPSARAQMYSTGMVAITDCPMSFKGTIGETGGWGGNAFVSTPQVIPGVVDKLWQPLSIERALGSALAAGPTVRYVTQGTATNAAAGVAEGGLKPESTLGFITTDEPIKKVATITSVSDELLEDSPAVQTFINSQRITFVNLEAERQLLRGTSGGNEVQGLLTSRSVPVYAGGTAAGNKAEQLFKAINGVRGSAFVEPDFLIVHPSDYQDIRLLKDSNNQLYGGGPFFGPYGAGAMASASGQVTGATDSIWSKPVYVTAAIGSGTAVVGTSAAATVYNRGGVSVEASNNLGSYFQYNLVAIRAERRLGLAVMRSGAFCEVRLS